MAVWKVVVHPALEDWIASLDDDQFERVFEIVGLLEQLGPDLGRPYVDTVRGSEHRNMKELRVQTHGRPWRILFAFDPSRRAVLLAAGDKASSRRWYERNIAIADRRFSEWLEEGR